MRAKPGSPPCRRWAWCQTATEQPPRGQEEAGRTVCACFGEAAIVEAIQSGCVTAIDIGVRLKAGTNCGSCLPEIKGLITRAGAVKKIA
jgi:NAD(P)H-nitrite reductase large subunit